MIEPMSGFTPL